MAKKKENDSVKNTVMKTARYGSLRPNFPRDPGSISIRYGSPRLDPEEPVKPREPEGLIRYGCPRPETQKKPSKLSRIIKVIKGN